MNVKTFTIRTGLFLAFLIVLSLDVQAQDPEVGLFDEIKSETLGELSAYFIDFHTSRGTPKTYIEQAWSDALWGFEDVLIEAPENFENDAEIPLDQYLEDSGAERPFDFALDSENHDFEGKSSGIGDWARSNPEDFLTSFQTYLRFSEDPELNEFGEYLDDRHIDSSMGGTELHFTDEHDRSDEGVGPAEPGDDYEKPRNRGRKQEYYDRERERMP